MLTTDKEILKDYARSKCLWMGIPSIEVTKKGRTFLTFYSGGTTEQIGNFVGLIQSDDGVNFTDPVAVCKPEEGYRCFDSNVWIDPLGRLWLTWSRCPLINLRRNNKKRTTRRAFCTTNCGLSGSLPLTYGRGGNLPPAANRASRFVGFSLKNNIFSPYRRCDFVCKITRATNSRPYI